jgi:hypothetical protein
MAVSKFTSSANANDFNVNITSTYSTATLDREYPLGSYSIVSSVNDTSIDIYAFNSLGTLVGYTGTKAFTATAGFSKLVVLGGTTGDVISFSYKTTFTTSAETAETGAGPVLLGATPTSLPNDNNSLTLTGYNFASGMSVTFTGSDLTARPAKSVIVGSATSAIVTRPDVLPLAYSPYTLSAYNSGVNTPVGSNSHILATPTISAGVAPTWVTPAALPAAYYNSSYSITLSATDADAGSAVTYAYVAGALPAGLSFNPSTAVISGTPTSSTYGSYSYTVSATDSGLNTVNQVFTMILNPVLGGTIASDSTYFYQTFTANATLTVNQSINVDYLVVAGGGGGATDADVGGGGGGGGLLTGNTTLSATTYPIVVGLGGSRGSGPDNTGVGGGGNGTQGGNSTFNGLTAIGGGYGGTRSSPGGSGGSGGGGGDSSQLGGAGTSGQGYAGGTGPGMNTQSGNDSGGGGGAGGAASFNNPGPGLYSAVGRGTFAAGGRGAQLTGPINSTDGTGNGGTGARNGASGIVVIRYTRSQVGS